MTKLPETTCDSPIIPARVMWWMLGVLVVFAFPLFVCSPVTSDTSLFDLQAMNVQKGGVPYRDIVEPNLPGAVWIHLGLRSIVGWSSEAMRTADLLILLCTLTLLTWVVSGNQTNRARGLVRFASPVFLFACLLFYVTRNEWCHCQRDIWMLLPVSLALAIRLRRESVGGGAAIAEGVAWALAFWIKPHVAIPAIAVMIVDCNRFGSIRTQIKDGAFVVAGGVLAAIPGIWWLISTGAWEHFWDMMLTWNPEYLETGKARRSWERIDVMFHRFYPWWLVHIAAIPVALMSLWNRFKPSIKANLQSHRVWALSACYIAWIAQTFVLQHAMDYIHVPEVILAMAVLTAYPWKLELPVRRVAVAALLVLAVISMPQLRKGRPAVWLQCFTSGSSPQTRSVLAQGNFPNWEHIDNVRAFLESQNAADEDISCTNVHSVHLLKELNVLPANRYWSVNCLLTMFPSRYEQIMTTVNDSRHRFVVVEETETAYKGQVLPEVFPRQFPVVFESATYKVYATEPALVQQ